MYSRFSNQGCPEIGQPGAALCWMVRLINHFPTAYRAERLMPTVFPQATPSLPAEFFARCAREPCIFCAR